MKEVYSLTTAAHAAEVLQECLESSESSRPVQLLQQTSRKAMATLEDGACLEQTMKEQVAAVYGALDNALRQGARESFKKHCANMLKQIYVYDPQDAEITMGEMYEHARPYFLACVAQFIRVIYSAIVRGPVSASGSAWDVKPQPTAALVTV